MLSNTLKNTMDKAMKYENITKASKFSNSDNVNKTEKSLEEEFLMLQKISKFVKNNNETSQIQNNNTKKLKQELENIKKIELPFFKSIQYKLSEVFSV